MHLRMQTELSRWITSPPSAATARCLPAACCWPIIATVICLVIAFPVGYFLSRLRVNKQHIMLMLVMLPMWMNFLLRTYAWMGLLSINGPVNAVLGVFGLGPFNILNTSGAVVLAWCITMCPI